MPGSYPTVRYHANVLLRLETFLGRIDVGVLRRIFYTFAFNTIRLLIVELTLIKVILFVDTLL